MHLAIERDVSYNHIQKVKNAQKGLLNHIKRINSRLSDPKLPYIERSALQKELSKASKLLDDSERFVPRICDIISQPHNTGAKAQL